MDGATQMLKRAVELDSGQKFSEAKVCYEEGIELLMKHLKTSTNESMKTQVRGKITSYMKRAEELKEHIRTHRSVWYFIKW